MFRTRRMSLPVQARQIVSQEDKPGRCEMLWLGHGEVEARQRRGQPHPLGRVSIRTRDGSAESSARSVLHRIKDTRQT